MLSELKDFPGLRQLRIWRYERLFRTSTDKNLFRGMYSSLAMAAAAVPPSLPQGYDNANSASLYEDRRHQIFATDYPVLFWLHRIVGEIGTVFDFGGHRGVSYFSYRQHLDFSRMTKWIVYDVPAVVEAGKRLLESEGLKQLTFSGDASLATSADLFFASGSLQYVDDPLAEIAGKGRPKHVLINMLPVGENGEFFTVQNIGTAFCPYHIYDTGIVEKTFIHLGYKLVDRWDNPGKVCHVPFEKQAGVKYVGFYFAKS